MDITTNTKGNTDYTGHFMGRRCRILEGYDAILSFGDMNTDEMIESPEFRILENAGFEVHRDWQDEYLEKRRRQRRGGK